MEKEILKTVKEYSLIDEGDIIIVGLSGGADSVSLLLSLSKLRETLKIKKIIAVHINHMLRDTARRDEEFCENLCKKLDIDFYKKSVDIAKLKDELKVCEEEAGRIARYSFFNEIKEKTGASKIATAHNKNDQTETFFMRILRGAGTDGLSGIKPVREDGVIRPLINVQRETIIKYLDEYNQEYMTDETNLKPDYLRNKIRLELIPYLKDNFDLKDDVISNTVNSLREDSEYLRYVAEKYVNADNDRVELNLKELKEMSPAILKRVIGLSVKELGGGSILKENIKNVTAIIKRGITGKKAEISKNIEAVTDYNKFIIKKKDKINKYFYNLNMGENFIEEAELKLTLSDKLSDSKDSINIPDFSSLTVRTRKEGDKVEIKNVGHKKIKEIFIDKKISRYMRDSFPVICLDGEIIWLYGLYKKEFENVKYNLKAEWRRG